MSAFGKRGTRCDTCGKFSRNGLTGEYVRKDGSQGYIWPIEDSNKDICDDCIERQQAATLLGSKGGKAKTGAQDEARAANPVKAREKRRPK